MRISDWSSDVCSSDLAYDHGATGLQARLDRYRAEAGGTKRLCAVRQHRAFDPVRLLEAAPAARVDRRTSAGGERHLGAGRADRKSAVVGKSGGGRVALGGSSSMKTNINGQK